MPLIDPRTAASKEENDLRFKLVLGIVVTNNDPAKLMRVKIRAHSIHRNVDDESLPWAIPYFNINPQGVGSGMSGVSVPGIGTKILFFFQDDSIMNPVYVGGFMTGNLAIEELNEDYPHSYGYIDRSGNLFFTNTEKDHIIINHVSGTSIKIDGAGRMSIAVADTKIGPNATTFNERGLSIDVIGNADISVEGNVFITATEEMRCRARAIHMNTYPGRPVRVPIARTRPVEVPLIEATDY